MAYPNHNNLTFGMTHRVHINPNFRGRIVCPAQNASQRPLGIHVNPHWKPKTDSGLVNEYKVTLNANGNLPEQTYGQRRIIHINPKVIASMRPESFSQLIEQENVANKQISTSTKPESFSKYVEPKPVANNPISVVSTGLVDVKPLLVYPNPDEKSAIQKLPPDGSNILNVKPFKTDGKENRSLFHSLRLKNNLHFSSSPAIRTAKTVRSKYKYLNNSFPSHSSVYSQHTVKRFNNEKQTSIVSSRFKYVRKSSQDVPSVGSSSLPQNRHIITRYKLVKSTASTEYGKSTLTSHTTPRCSKARRILENVKNTPVHRIKSHYGVLKGNVASRPHNTYKHNAHSNAPKIKSNSRFKFVRQTPLAQRTPQKRKSPRAVTSRYKIVRGTTTQSNETPKRTRYRASRYTTSTPAIRQKMLQQQLYRSTLRNRWMHPKAELRATKVVVTNKKLLRIGQRPRNRSFSTDAAKKTKLLNIGGVLYRSTRTTLTRSAANKRHIHDKGQILSIRGSKFILDKAGKTLQRLSPNGKSSQSISRIHIGGVTFVRSSENTLIRSRVHEARNLVSQAKQRSIAVLTSKLRKNNQPCLIYQRLGKCRLHEKGICLRVHDPKMIAVCNDFVNGKCLKTASECSLSHNIGPEKMPTCHFFLQGCCVRDPCPYVHVKLNKKAAVCRDFLSGYCNAGDKCKKRHVFLCPEFEERKTCSKGKYCKYRHAGTPQSKGTRANKSKYDIRTVARADQESSQAPNLSEENADPLIRYYVSDEGTSKPDAEGSDLISGRKDGAISKQSCWSNENEDCNNDAEKNIVEVLRPERSKLGVLPGYIPL